MKEILAQIVARIQKTPPRSSMTNPVDCEAKRLWDVLSALRGPDNGDIELKYATTAVIRGKVGFTLPNAAGFIVTKDDQSLVDIRRKLTLEKKYTSSSGIRPDPHFVMHAFNAFEALGLNWLSVNE